MKRSTKFVVGITVTYFMLCVVATAQQSVDEGQEREKTISWLKKSNKFGPDQAIVDDMTTHIDEETQQGFNISLYFGKDLMKAGEYQSIHLWSGQFFQFPLTDEQAAKLEVSESGVQTTTGKRQDKRAEKPLFQLSELKINEVEEGLIPGDKKITGTVKCQLLGEMEEGKSYALRQGYRTDVSVMRFHYFEEKPTQDGAIIEFSFDPINEADAEAFFGPLPAFMDICTVAEANGELDIKLLSNSLGAMLQVKE